MTRPRIIGIKGEARSGKNTVAEVCVEECGYMTYGFADPIKRALAGWLTNAAKTVSVHDIETLKAEIPIRKALQMIGTEIGRDIISKTLWIDCLKARIDPTLKIGFNIVIPDVRFLNEAAAIRDWGGVVWGVRRPDHEDELPNECALHKSEMEVSEIQCDHTFVNDGSVDALRDQAREALGVETAQVKEA